MRHIIEVSGLTHRYGDFVAVDAISFSVGEGEFFGFVGPNGAGKTTTINILATLLTPTAGSASVNGFDVVRQRNAVRASIGVIFQDPSLDLELTAWENLWMHAKLYRVPRATFDRRASEFLALLGLTDWRTKRVQTFSGGMKRRLEIARGLLHEPQILFLDEPTIGLDPQTRALIWQHLKRLRDVGGTTIFLTTHYLPETEQCDHVAVMDHGRIVAYGTTDELKERFGQQSMDAVFIEATGHGIRDEELSSEAQARATLRRHRRFH